jgi:sarcosine oxidase subunit gamma
VTVEPLTPVDLAQVGVRADPEILPFAAPEPNTATAWNGRDVLWLGPDEWLVVGEPDAARAIERELAHALVGRHHSVIDVGANRTVFDLNNTLEALSSGCGLDLDPSRWRPGMCAQTLLGQAQVILHQRDERTTRVFVRRSFSDHFLAWLGAVNRSIGDPGTSFGERHA